MPSINSDMNDSIIHKYGQRRRIIYKYFPTMHYQKLLVKHKGNFHLPLPNIKIFTALLQKVHILTKNSGFDML